MYIWSHGFEMMNTQRLDADGRHNPYDTPELGYYQSYSQSNNSLSQITTAVKTGTDGPGWVWKRSKAGHTKLGHAYISTEASRPNPMSHNGPTGKYGAVLWQDGQVVWPLDVTTPFRLNQIGKGSVDPSVRQSFAVSIDVKFDAGFEFSPASHDIGLIRTSLDHTSNPVQFPAASNRYPCRLDVNTNGQLTIVAVNNTGSYTHDLVATSAKSLPTGKWIRVCFHVFWDVQKINCTARVDGEVFVQHQGTVNVAPICGPSTNFQGFAIGYCGAPSTDADPGVVPNRQCIDNMVAFYQPTQEELTTDYYCIPIWPSVNGDDKDVIWNGQISGAATAADDTWKIGPTDTFMPSSISAGMYPQANGETAYPSVNYRPWAAAQLGPADGLLTMGLRDIVVRPQIPAKVWGTDYDPKRLEVLGVTMAASYGPPRNTQSAVENSSPTLTNFPNDASLNYWLSPGWRSNHTPRLNEYWPTAASSGSPYAGGVAYMGRAANMWWVGSSKKQTSGVSWVNFGNAAEYTNWSWVDDFENASTPMQVRAGIVSNVLSTCWGVFGLYMDTCVSFKGSESWKKKPNAQLIIKDTLFDSPQVVDPKPSETSPYMAMPYASTTNRGAMLPFMEGFWNDDLTSQNPKGKDLNLKVTDTGTLGYDACFAWKFKGEPDSAYRTYMDQNMHWGHHNPFSGLKAGLTGEPFPAWISSPYLQTKEEAMKSAHCVAYSSVHDRLLIFWWNPKKNSYAIAYRNMSSENYAWPVGPHSGSVDPSAEGNPYKYIHFTGGYENATEFPENKLVGGDCPYIQCVELLDGTMRLFHCYKDILKPTTNGWAPFLDATFETSFYNIDMYISTDGGLTWDLVSERVLDEPFGDSRAIRHFSAAADGQWLRLDFMFYDTIYPGPAYTFESGEFGGYWMPGRLGCSSGDGGATWKVSGTRFGNNPDGYDHSLGNAQSGIYVSGVTRNWSIQTFKHRTDETASICGSGRNDGTFWRFRSTYNQDALADSTSSTPNRWGYLTGWFIGKDAGTTIRSKLTQDLTLGVFEAASRGDEWGIISTPSLDGHSATYDGPRALTYGRQTLCATGTPNGSYFTQVTNGYTTSGGIIPWGARWDGAFSWMAPNTNPFDYASESGGGVTGFIPDFTGSWYAAARDQYGAQLEGYLYGTETEANYFDHTGLSQGVANWGMTHISQSSVWAGDRIVRAYTQSYIPGQYANESTTQKMYDDWGLPIFDIQIPPVTVSFNGGWEKRALRRTQHPSNYFKPHIWYADWTAANGVPAGDNITYSAYPGAGAWPFASVPASTPSLWIQPKSFYPAYGEWNFGRWGMFSTTNINANFQIVNKRSVISTNFRYWNGQNGAAGVSGDPYFGYGGGSFHFTSGTTFASMVGSTLSGTSQLIGEGGLIDCSVGLKAGLFPYKLRSTVEPPETNAWRVTSFATPGRGFVVETARNNSLTGGSTVHLGVSVNVLAPSVTMLSSPTLSSYWGQISVHECEWNGAVGGSIPAKTIWTSAITPPTDDACKATTNFYNIRLAFVDGYTLSPATTYSYIQTMYRRDSTNDDWTISGLHTLMGLAEAGASSTQNQMVRWGMIQPQHAGTYEYNNDWRYFRYSRGREAHMGAGYTDASSKGTGSVCSPFPTIVTQGVATKWGGSSAFAGDSFESPLRFTHGTDQLQSDSPQMYWRSIGALTETITMLANKEGSTSLKARFRHNALGLFGMNARKVNVTYGTDTSFSSVVTTFTVDATQYSDVLVDSVYEDHVTVDPRSALKWGQNELSGMYVEANTPKGKSYTLRVHSNWGNRIKFEPLDNVLTSYVDTWTTMHIYDDKAVHLYKTNGDGVIAQAMKVEFPEGSNDYPLGPAAPIEGYWKLGSLVPGMTVGFDVPLDWSDDQETEPNVILTTLDSGVRTAYKQGQPRETYRGSLAGSDVGKFRTTIKKTLDHLTEYSVRPLVLCIDDNQASKNSLYSRWTGSVKLKNEGYRYNEDTLTWDKIGTLEVDFEEEV